MVRAKFTVTEKTAQGEQFNITLWPVTSGSEENKTFFKWTPCGKIELGTVNEAAAKQFEVGKEFYVDFTLAN